MSLTDALKTALFGFKPGSTDGFIRLFAGGGLLSMVTVMLLVFISSTYSGIFNGTRMLDSVEELLEKVACKIGVFPTTLVSAVFANFAACSQTLAVILQTQLLGPVYRKRKISNTRFALDVSNTTSRVAGLVPWSISFTVPVVGMLGGTVAVIPYLAFLYITPLWALGRYFVKKKEYAEK